MGKEYLKTALDATELITEIYPGDEHPFPVPEGLMPRIREIRRLIREPMAPRGEPTFASFHGTFGPEFLFAWEQSLTHLGSVSAALDLIWRQLPDCPEISLVEVASLSLEREICRLQAVLEWTRATWQYDPAIRAAVDRQPDPGPEESVTSSEAPALQ